MKMSRDLTYAVGFSVAMSMMASESVQAQTADAEVGVAIEEIVVTARKREESLQKVPETVLAITSSMIEDQDLTSIEHFVQLIPNAFVNSGSFGLNDTIVIRGVGALNFDFFEQATGIYRDGYFMGGSRTVFPDIVDLQRVEVLRGPQGGLYGRNAVGGAVNFIYNQPDLERTSGNVELGYGSYQRYEARGTVNVPIDNNRAALRLNSWFIDQDEGEYFNITRNEFQDDTEQAGARVTLLYQVSDSIDMSTQFEFMSEDGYENVSAFDIDGGETKKTIEKDSPSEAARQTIFLGETLNWGTTVGTFTGLFSYREYEANTVADQDFGPLHGAEITRDETTKSIFAEARWLSPEDRALGWIVGATYFTEDLRLDRFNESFDPTGASAGFSTGEHFIETDSFAFWGEATFAVTDRIELVASARHTSEDKGFDFQQRVTSSSSLLDIALPGLKGDFNNTSFGGGASWQATDDILIYARANEGFRPGGFNTLLTQGAAATVANATNEDLAALLSYTSETSLNLEIGAKSSWFDNRLNFNVAGFRLTQDDVVLGGFSPGTFIFIFSNFGKSTTHGIEAEISARPVENLDISASFGYLEGELDGPAPFGGFFIQGNNLTNFTLAATYRFPVAEGIDFMVHGNWRLMNDRDPSITPLLGSPNQEKLNDYSILNATVGLEGESWHANLVLSNITDDDYVIGSALGRGFGSPQANNRFNGFNWSLRAGVKF